MIINGIKKHHMFADHLGFFTTYMFKSFALFFFFSLGLFVFRLLVLSFSPPSATLPRPTVRFGDFYFPNQRFNLGPWQ